jgi:sugar lactone lactonase YvrE
MAAIRRASFFVVLILLSGVGLVSPVDAANHVTTLMTFDATAGELPEGLAIDHQQTMYLSFPLTGEIRAVTRDGVESTYATLPHGPGFGPLGIALDARGNLYVAVNTGHPTTQGVYVVRRDGTTERLAGTNAITFPNDVTLDPRGNVYVTDTSLGAVWRIPRGGTAELWLQHDLLEGVGGGPLVIPLGANGIEFRHSALYVGNTERGTIVRVPVLPDDTAGTPQVFAQSSALGGADGLAFDVRGNLYVAVIAQSAVVRISPDGETVTTIATTTDGLDFPSAVAFGTGGGERQTLFIINFAIADLFGVPPVEGPALLSLDAGVAGQPAP